MSKMNDAGFLAHAKATPLLSAFAHVLEKRETLLSGAEQLDHNFVHEQIDLLKHIALRIPQAAW